MLPDRCSVKEQEKRCVNPPEYVISVVVGNDEYMVGVTCKKHQSVVSSKVKSLQEQDKIPKGKINFSPLKPVGTDCIRTDSDDLINL